MDNYEDAIKCINDIESTDTSFFKISHNNKTLIISFAGNAHVGFERKSSLIQLKYQRNDFDLLFLRNYRKWYLGGLNKIGKNINHTISFLKKEFVKYNKIICIGSSAGGYASILFGSLLNANYIIGIGPQIDLEYTLKNLPKKMKPGLRDATDNLIARKKQCKKTWKKYNKLNDIINEISIYYINHLRTRNRLPLIEKVLHGEYHYNLIKDFPNVNKLNSKQNVLPLIIELLDKL